MNSIEVRQVLLEFVGGRRGSSKLKSEAVNILLENYGEKVIKLYEEGESREVEVKMHRPREIVYPPDLEKKLVRINKYILKPRWISANWPRTFSEFSILQ